MEHTNLPVVAKRIWHIVRVVFFMLRKGISKRKLMLDLNMMMKRGKIAGKAIHNLMFHHNSSAGRSHDSRRLSYSAPHEYEFSCSNSPAFSFHISKRSKHHNNSHFFPCAHASPTTDDVDVFTANAVMKALEMFNSSESVMASPALHGFLQSPMVRDVIYSELSSPALPGFGRSPMVRQLRITDSPYPLRDSEGDSQVDEAAEDFIVKFYNELKRQNKMALRY